MNEKNINEIADYRTMESRNRSIRTAWNGLAFIAGAGLLLVGHYDTATEGILAIESGALAGLVATITSHYRF